jgi:hypothetical protein
MAKPGEPSAELRPGSSGRATATASRRAPQNCYFDGIGLKGSWTSGSPAEGEYHAIKAITSSAMGRLYIDSWRGDGIHINVTAGSGGDTEGNATAPTATSSMSLAAVAACRTEGQ